MSSTCDPDKHDSLTAETDPDNAVGQQPGKNATIPIAFKVVESGGCPPSPAISREGGSHVSYPDATRSDGDGGEGTGGRSRSPHVSPHRSSPENIDNASLGRRMPSRSSGGSHHLSPGATRAHNDGFDAVRGGTPIDLVSKPKSPTKNTAGASSGRRPPSPPFDVDCDAEECELAAERAVTSAWISTKVYQYLIHHEQPFRERIGTVLQGLRVKQDNGEWIVLFPEHGQLVQVGGIEFTLILCIQTKKFYRLWIHDGCKSYVCAPKDVQREMFLTGETKSATLKSRMVVRVIAYVLASDKYVFCVGA